MRRKVIAGNWKMNMLPGEAINFIEELTPAVANTQNEVILCVPYTDLFYTLLKRCLYRRNICTNVKINRSRICNNRTF